MNSDAPWAVRHLSLREPLVGLPAEPDFAGIYLVLWWGSVPLGHLELAQAYLPLDAHALRQRIAAAIAPTLTSYWRSHAAGDALGLPGSLRELDATLEYAVHADASRAGRALDQAAPSVSLVICTRDRPEALARCLDSLATLTLRPSEVVVVDNCPRSAATAQLVASRPGLRYALEPQPGLDRARNTGVRVSRGDLIAFIDDDVTVHTHWLEQLVAGFDAPEIMAVTGLVLPAELETRAQLLFETHWGFHRGYEPRVFDAAHFARRRRCPSVWEMGAGANMGFRRQAFERLGGFDERLDAGAAGVAGDSEFWYRVLAAGFSCRYQPSAVVHHWHRREMDALEAQLFAYMRGHVTALLIQRQRYAASGNLTRLLAVLPRHYAGVALRALKRRHRPRAATLRAELVGCAAGVGYYFATRAQAAHAVPSFVVSAEPALEGGAS